MCKDTGSRWHFQQSIPLDVGLGSDYSGTEHHRGARGAEGPLWRVGRTTVLSHTDGPRVQACWVLPLLSYAALSQSLSFSEIVLEE